MGPVPDLEIGVMVSNLHRDRYQALKRAVDLRFDHAHIGALPESWLSDPERSRFVSAVRSSGLAITTMFVGFDGQSYIDLPTIRQTVGLTIPAFRDHRAQIALQYSELANDLGIGALGMHLGFLPGPRGSAEYAALVRTLRRILDHCGGLRQTVHLETGQETGEELWQFLEAVDRPNLGVNFDPANFLLYDTDDPAQALGCLAPYIQGVHCKDGVRPRQPGILGVETPLGQGRVDYRALLRELLAIHYRGTLVIEREHGSHVEADVLAAREHLQRLLRELRAQAPWSSTWNRQES